MIRSTLEEVENLKNDAIREIQSELKKIREAHSNMVKTYEGKLSEFGIPVEELGFDPLVPANIWISIILHPQIHTLRINLQIKWIHQPYLCFFALNCSLLSSSSSPASIKLRWCSSAIYYSWLGFEPTTVGCWIRLRACFLNIWIEWAFSYLP